jgi:hypothetical protein
MVSGQCCRVASQHLIARRRHHQLPVTPRPPPQVGVRWTMLMTALREAGLPRSALSRIAILAADNPSFSQLAMLCNSASV